MTDKLLSSLVFKIVKRLREDITDRRGFRQQWDMTDRPIQREILKDWRQIVRDELSRSLK